MKRGQRGLQGTQGLLGTLRFVQPTSRTTALVGASPAGESGFGVSLEAGSLAGRSPYSKMH